MLRISIAVVAGAMFVTPASQAIAQVAPDAVLTQVITEKSLSLHYEILAAKSAVDACTARGAHATVVVVDSRGNVKVQMVGDGGNYNLLDEARRKARTAAFMHRSTLALQQAMAANPNMRVPPDPDFLVLPGGAAILAGAEIVGAVGVAGAPPEVAAACAEAGVDRLNDYLHPEPPVASVAPPGAQPVAVPK